MTIGAAIIAKNESDNIFRLLSYISDFVDQIVVVDTGSTDNTPKQCLKFGAELYYKIWNNNFSEIRNFALEHMRTDWIIALDCDEIIEKEQFDNIYSLINEPQTGGINVKILNHLGNGTKSVHHYTRIFKNHQKIKYSGRIHEQIRPSIENLDLNIINSNIEIIHNGYFENDYKKQIRNKELLLLDINDNPNDHWLKYHLANTEFAMKNFDDAEQLYKSIFNSKELSVDQNEMLRIRLAQISLENENFENIYKFTEFQSVNKDVEGLRQFIVAGGKMLQGKYTEAENIYKNISLIHSNLVNYEIVKNALRFLNNKIDNHI